MTTALSAAHITLTGVPTLPRREVTGAWLMLLGLTIFSLGGSWDLQWHISVGPDTFFTAPHLMFYAGSALIGFTCLAVVLATTWDARRGAPASHSPTVTVLGTFRAPLAFLVGGLGAAGHLLYGATDLWWHTIYGFDVLENTPSHLGLNLATLVEAAGLVMAFAARRGTRAGRWGFAAACVYGFSELTVFQFTDGVVLGVDMPLVTIGWICALMLALAAGVTRTARWMVAPGLLMAAVAGITLLFVPSATRLYADSLGLSFRDGAPPVYAIGLGLLGVLLAYLLVSVLAVGVVQVARRRGVPPVRVMPALGALAGVVGTGVSAAFGPPAAGLTVTLLAAAVLGAGAGWLGWHCAALLRRLDPEKAA